MDLSYIYLMNRKAFIRYGASATAGYVFSRKTPSMENSIPVEAVHDFVSASHSDLQPVSKLLIKYPNLIYASWDWGNGDFESGLEAAAHVGNKGVANYLINKGGRPNVFVLTMLGKTKIVKALVEEFPFLLYSYGAHGFTLLHHAKKADNEGVKLMEYFHEKGLHKDKIDLSQPDWNKR